MSKYTTELRYICEKANGLEESEGYSSIDAIIAGAIPKIFDFDFPLFDPNYKNVICGKILMHYYTQEIGFETVGLWKLKLRTKLNEIMPYYNKLYKSELLDFNPFYDVDLTTEHSATGSRNEIYNAKDLEQRENESTQRTENVTDSLNWNLFSDTPQNGLTEVDRLRYLTEATKNTNEGTTVNENTSTSKDGNTKTTENEGEVKTVDDYITRVSGKNGGVSYSKLLQEFRETFLNIDLMVINDLQDLFMGVW